MGSKGDVAIIAAAASLLTPGKQGSTRFPGDNNGQAAS